MDSIIHTASETALKAESIVTEMQETNATMQRKLDEGSAQIDAQVANLKAMMQTVALYKDFKDLYKKVVPPVSLIQEQLEKFSQEHEQNRAIIQAMDEKMESYALKHEIIQYSNELRHFARREVVEQHIEESVEFMADYKEKFKDLHKVVQSRDKGFEQLIRSLIHQKMLAVSALQSKKDKESLSPEEVEDLKQLQNKVHKMVNAKADQTEITMLREQKTNKSDTEHVIRAIATMHRMMDNLITLMIEFQRVEHPT